MKIHLKMERLNRVGGDRKARSKGRLEGRIIVGGYWVKSSRRKMRDCGMRGKGMIWNDCFLCSFVIFLKNGRWSIMKVRYYILLINGRFFKPYFIRGGKSLEFTLILSFLHQSATILIPAWRLHLYISPKKMMRQNHPHLHHLLCHFFTK